jgi:hypothetical protein
MLTAMTRKWLERAIAACLKAQVGCPRQREHYATPRKSRSTLSHRMT